METLRLMQCAIRSDSVLWQKVRDLPLASCKRVTPPRQSSATSTCWSCGSPMSTALSVIASTSKAASMNGTKGNDVYARMSHNECFSPAKDEPAGSRTPSRVPNPAGASLAALVRSLHEIRRWTSLACARGNRNAFPLSRPS